MSVVAEELESLSAVHFYNFLPEFSSVLPSGQLEWEKNCHLIWYYVHVLTGNQVKYSYGFRKNAFSDMNEV